MILLATKSQHSHHHHHGDGDHHHHEHHDATEVKVKKEVVDPVDDDIKVKEEPVEETLTSIETKFVPTKELKKTPPLEDLVSKFLDLQFGSERIVNLSPMTEQEYSRKYLWSVKVDNHEATVIVAEDGATWVSFSYLIFFRTSNQNMKS